jgi:hydrogenase nickel incorporation protein HypA/HybF
VLRLGALRDIQKQWIEHYFGYISKGTAAEGAEILILVDPIICRCGRCRKEFEIERDSYSGETVACPDCSATEFTLISGTAFRIEGIEVI